MTLRELCENAKSSTLSLINVSEKKINRALKKAAKLLIEQKDKLKEKNALDIEEAQANGKSDAFIDRLTLSDSVIEGMAEGLKKVAKLKSPTGKVVYKHNDRKQGIKIKKITVPFGVIGIIFESRPNVTADAFALCFKTKNAVVLKGGSDALNSNKEIVRILKQALYAENIDGNVVSLIEDTTHETAKKFMRMNGFVDLLIPRGSARLIKSALENATVPIIETGAGNCHAYIDETADAKKAADIIFNAKTQRYSVCNALESIVIHKNALKTVLPIVAERLKEKQIEMRCDARAFQAIKDYPYLKRAETEDYKTEYGGPIISVKTVDDINAAIAHINENSTHHSETIITENKKNAEKFLSEIDSAAVYYNASTRFTDGFVFGLGAEIGISTQKLHARGPMGLDALTTAKYEVTGNGAVRK